MIPILLLSFLTLACTSRVEEGQPAQGKTESIEQPSVITGGGDACQTPSGILLNDGESLDVYSVDSVPCGTTCESQKGQITCNNGTLTGNADYSHSSCTSISCRCKYGDTYLNEGQSVEYYNRTTGHCDIDAEKCENNKATVTCGPGGVLSGADPAVYPHRNCNRPTCYCDLGNGINIRWGSSRRVYVNDTVGCGERCSASENSGRVYCSNTGELTGAITMANFGSCNEPDCSCDTPTGINIQYGANVVLFDRETVGCGEKCEDYTGTVSCTIPNTAEGSPPASLNYQFSSCIPESCEGSGGGDGGGTGNDYGPGMGWFDDGGGGGGGGGGAAGNVVILSQAGCNTPWAASTDPDRNPAGNFSGKISEGVEIVAYSQSSVVCGERCSDYSQVRTCRNGVLSGDASFNQKECTSPCP